MLGFGSSGKHFVAAQISATHCGPAVSGGLLALYELGHDGTLRPLNQAGVEVGEDFGPALLLDLDHDGNLELVSAGNHGYDESLLGIQQGALGFVEWVPYFLGHCSC